MFLDSCRTIQTLQLKWCGPCFPEFGFVACSEPAKWNRLNGFEQHHWDHEDSRDAKRGAATFMTIVEGFIAAAFAHEISLCCPGVLQVLAWNYFRHSSRDMTYEADNQSWEAEDPRDSEGLRAGKVFLKKREAGSFEGFPSCRNLS